MSFESVRSQTLMARQRLADILGKVPDNLADLQPGTSKNNLRWHTGHLIITPRLLVFGLLGEHYGVPTEFRKWFGKDSSPEAWGSAPVPTFSELREMLVPKTEELFDAIRDRWETKYANPYLTSVGLTLESVDQAVSFSLFHDGVHLGLILALLRDLKAQR